MGTRRLGTSERPPSPRGVVHTRGLPGLLITPDPAQGQGNQTEARAARKAAPAQFVSPADG